MKLSSARTPEGEEFRARRRLVVDRVNRASAAPEGIFLGSNPGACRTRRNNIGGLFTGTQRDSSLCHSGLLGGALGPKIGQLRLRCVQYLTPPTPPPPPPRRTLGKAMVLWRRPPVPLPTGGHGGGLAWARENRCSEVRRRGRVLLPGGVGVSAACAEGPGPGRDAGDLPPPGCARQGPALALKLFVI